MSNVTLEQVEKLQSKANVSYKEAKEALEKCDGDILEALIQLEQDGKTAPGAGAYSTGGQNANSYAGNNQGGYSGNDQGGPQMNYGPGQYQGQYQESEFNKQAKSLWKSFKELVHKGNINHFVISKNDQEIVRMPINILIILLIVFNAAAVIALIIFLFFGFKYNFDGPNLGKQNINSVMDSASSAAEDIKDSVRNSTANNQNDDVDGPENQNPND